MIVFETDVQGQHTWQWTVAWDVFSATGTATTASNTWDAASALLNCGGTPTVIATAAGQTARITVEVQGTNPTEADVRAYLATRPNSAGFGRIIRHENKFKHFTNRNVPAKSFDKGALCAAARCAEA